MNPNQENLFRPLQPRSIRAQPTWRTLNSSLGSLAAGNKWGPPDRAPGANAGKQRASNTPAKGPHRATRAFSELPAKGADESPLKPSGATRHGGGCCSPSPDQTGGLASSCKCLGARPPHDHKGEREKAQIPPPSGDRAGEAALGAVAVPPSRVWEREVMHWQAFEELEAEKEQRKRQEKQFEKKERKETARLLI